MGTEIVDTTANGERQSGKAHTRQLRGDPTMTVKTKAKRDQPFIASDP